MVNWHDPAVLEKEYLAVLKLNHVVAGIYIWETMFTLGFELDVLRGKRPYRRTIWVGHNVMPRSSPPPKSKQLYLGTRYTALLAFIVYFIDIDSSVILPCQLVTTTSYVRVPHSITHFATAIECDFDPRRIAIWDRNIFVSLLVIGTWLGDLGLNIYGSFELRATYDPTVETCNLLDFRKILVNVVCILVVDVVLLMSMLIGLLRYSHRNSTGLWHLLYQQCIIWLFLAAIADVPLLVFISLNLNDAMNDAFSAVTVSIMSIAAGRMYRSLFEHAFSTEHMPPHVSRITSQYRAPNIHGNIRVTSSHASVFKHTQLEVSPDTSIPMDLDANLPPAPLSPDIEKQAHGRSN
ncbi:hypothetical protein BGW80DRAFT_1466352 [Lactifluus volemus]|nr:hypothetical protein BGW80DRAFT_1466352 [Lactifluus volemus]